MDKPIYPTFLELINYIVNRGDPKLFTLTIEELMLERIPATAAEELGIIPINACDLNNYVESEWR